MSNIVFDVFCLIHLMHNLGIISVRTGSVYIRPLRGGVNKGLLLEYKKLIAIVFSS